METLEYIYIYLNEVFVPISYGNNFNCRANFDFHDIIETRVLKQAIQT